MHLSTNIWLKDEGGFKRFFEKQYPSLCIFADHYLQDKDASADIVQEAFVYVWSKREYISDAAAARSYLYKYIKNHCLNLIRDTKRRHEILFERLESPEFFRDNLIEREAYEIIYSAIKDLSSQNQQVIELSLDGLSNKEIAEQLDITINTVKTIKQRSFKTLRRVLSPSLFTFLCMFSEN
ncbi:sigma-70 family RNA polymerase sigma factor [Maribellus sp. YY47]|uniref:RNA polymerase sigma factor n=1 Tax=Maribellus sp. YY47 TaxID=2929486 RepID=UPI002000CC80|nr:sigma-70 family RNA polymerase sigma factor [Maribellus sp. YY47]MCK3683459.1 sigma-70 family RNA polymerase sigma factor [Maribellus sp. YY47]